MMQYSLLREVFLLELGIIFHMSYGKSMVVQKQTERELHLPFL